MSRYVETKLGEIAKTNTTSYSEKEKWNFVNYLDTGSITQNVIESVQYIDLNTEKLPSRAKRKVRKNSIVFHGKAQPITLWHYQESTGKFPCINRIYCNRC